MKLPNASLSEPLRKSLVRSAPAAKEYWGNTVLEARTLVADNLIFKAMVHYSNAMIVADILLDIDANAQASEARYARTAVELAYLYRRMQHQRSMMSLLSSIRHRLRFKQLEYNETELLEVIDEVAEAPQQQVESWFKRLEETAQIQQEQSDSANRESTQLILKAV